MKMKKEEKILKDKYKKTASANMKSVSNECEID
jgi:hypothetical protein